MSHVSYWRRCCRALLLLPFIAHADDNAVALDNLHSLDVYLAAILSTHPQLKAADATLLAVEAHAEALAQPVYNPELNLSGERAQSNSYSLGLSQTFDLSGKRIARSSSGQMQLQQATAERAALRQRLITDVVAALIDYRDKQAALALWQQRLQLLQRFAEIAEQQYRAGDIGLLDRNLATLAHAEAVAGLGRAELEQLQARRTLDLATRVPTLAIPELSASPPPPEHLADDYSAVAQSLPAIRAAMARQEASVAQVAIARSNRRVDPTLSLSGGRETSMSEPGKALVGLQLTIPLLLRNNFSAEQAAANAEADVARIETTALYQQALNQLETSAHQYRTVFASWQRWQAATSDVIDNGIELLDKVWAAHEVNTAEYLMQVRQLLDGRAAGAELKFQTWRAWSNWLAASGAQP